MGKVLLGIVIGLVISFAVGYFVVEDMKKKSYAEGLAKGQTEGEQTGRAKGIELGRAEQKRIDDSARTAEEAQLIAAEKAKAEQAAARRKPVNYDINYNMSGNQVGERRED